MTSGVGQCPQCLATNAYSRTECHVCRARLPWADAISGAGNASRGVALGTDEPSFILALLGFFCWPAGVTVWALQRDRYPRRSASALKGSVASLIISFAIFGAVFSQGLFSNRIKTVFSSAPNVLVSTLPPSISRSATPTMAVASPSTVASTTPQQLQLPAPLPTPTPRSLYHLINLKMSYEEVVKAIGRKENRKVVKPDFVTYIWKSRANEADAAHRGTTLYVTFNEGSISQISQHG